MNVTVNHNNDVIKMCNIFLFWSIRKWSENNHKGCNISVAISIAIWINSRDRNNLAKGCGRFIIVLTLTFNFFFGEKTHWMEKVIFPRKIHCLVNGYIIIPTLETEICLKVLHNSTIMQSGSREIFIILNCRNCW